MAISYEVLDSELDGLRISFFSVIENPNQNSFVGTLLTINPKGVPIEFAYSNLVIKPTFLWKGDDRVEYATVELVKELFGKSKSESDLVICRAEQVSSTVFSRDLTVTVPVARFASNGVVAKFLSEETTEALGSTAGELYWAKGFGEGESKESQIVKKLCEVGLIEEPFVRSESAIRQLCPKYFE